MHKVNVVLDEVLEARNHFLIELSELDFCLALDDLVNSQRCRLVFKQLIVGEREAYQAIVLTDLFQQA